MEAFSAVPPSSWDSGAHLSQVHAFHYIGCFLQALRELGPGFIYPERTGPWQHFGDSRGSVTMDMDPFWLGALVTTVFLDNVGLWALGTPTAPFLKLPLNSLQT